MYTSTAEIVIWSAVAAVAVLAGTVIVSAVRARMRRRARYLHYLQASRWQERTTSAPMPLAGALTPELAYAIRQHAERTAGRHWHAGKPETSPLNPYEPGTQEHVLWYASYELTMHEFVDAVAGQVVELGGR